MRKEIGSGVDLTTHRCQAKPEVASGEPPDPPNPVTPAGLASGSPPTPHCDLSHFYAHQQLMLTHAATKGSHQVSREAPLGRTLHRC